MVNKHWKQVKNIKREHSFPKDLNKLCTKLSTTVDNFVV